MYREKKNEIASIAFSKSVTP